MAERDAVSGEPDGGDDGCEAVGPEGGPTPARTGATRLAARIVASGLGAAVVVCAVRAQEWLGPRAVWAAILVVAALVAMWLPPRARAGSLCGAVSATTAAIVIVSGLGRATEIPDEHGRGAEVAGHATGAVPDEPVMGRILGRDLPPDVGYVAGVAVVVFAAIVVVAALQSLRRGGTSAARGPGTWPAIVVGAVVTAAVIPAVAAGGSAARSAAERRAERDSLLHEIGRPAERRAELPGPVDPSTERWRVDWNERYGEPRPAFEGVVAVPGWDAMVGYVRSPSSVVAFSATDGSELWRYGRRDGLIGGITVDPETGRVLVLSGRSAVVLDIGDGSETVARRLPFAMDAPGVNNGGGNLVGPDFTGHPGEGGPIVTTGSTAVVYSHPTLAVIDVASGELVASGTPSAGRCSRPRFAAVTSLPSPVMVQWGLSIGGDGCGDPTLLAVGDDGRIEPVAEIPAPPELTSGQGCYAYGCGSLAVPSETVVLFSRWSTRSGGTVSELVALSKVGEVRWRAPVDDTEAYRDPVAVTESGVVVRAVPQCVPPCHAPDVEWRLLSLTDGAELATETTSERTLGTWTSDGDHVYTWGLGGLTVRRVDDLGVVGRHEGFPMPQRLFAGSGVLVSLDDESGDMVGYGDPATTADAIRMPGAGVTGPTWQDGGGSAAQTGVPAGEHRCQQRAGCQVGGDGSRPVGGAGDDHGAAPV